jgi:hypothetical protein
MRNKSDNIGDITQIADIPEGMDLTVPCKLRLIEFWVENGAQRLTTRQAAYIIAEWNIKEEQA